MLGVAALDLDLFSILGRRAQRHRNVAGNEVTGNRNDGGVANGAVGKDGDIGGTRTNVHQRHPKLALIFGQHRQAAGQRIEHQLLDFETAAAHTFDDVLGRTLCAGHDVHLGFQTDAAHADGLFYVLTIDDEFLRRHQQQALVGRDVDGFSGLQHPRHVSGAHLTVFNGHHAAGIEAADMAAGDASVNTGNLAVGHQLGFFERLLDALHRGLDVHHHAALEAVARRNAQPGEFELAAGEHLGHHHHHLGRTNVQAYDQIFVFFCHMFTC